MAGVSTPPAEAEAQPPLPDEHHGLHVRTHTADSQQQQPPPDEGAPPAADADGQWLSGPFRSAPLGYIMHETPTSTPLASPRDGPLPDQAGRPGGGDLEAPLLGGGRGKRQHPGQHFEDCGIVKAVVYGLINTAAGIPALIAFCAVVFKDPLYDPWIEPLCKFFYLASAVHQAVVSLRSAVPNAVGQVQDVGLIFLSAMASSIAALVAQAGGEPAEALGTALLTMAVSTALVGLGLVAVAKLKLAEVVQYLPLPAVGGYLSYVGYFCVASGLGLGCGIQLGSIASWAQLWDVQVALRVLPTAASCAAMMWTTARLKHPLALPGVLLAIVAAFHVVLLALGVSLEQAQEAGWVLKPAAPLSGLSLWRMFDMPGGSLQNIHFGAALQQVGKLLGLFLLVCFGSCMDVAAIQQDTPFRLDFNRELSTIGLSNIVTGVVGCGFTGSYIFSQTIFTGRAGVRSRVNGAVIAVCEFALFALPLSLVQYLPCFFFGSLLLWFGVEIVLDWMMRSYRKLSTPEYALLWLTFCAIMQFGLEAGIAAGIVMATLFFAWTYARSQLSSFALVPGRSAIVRSGEQEAALELLRPAHLLCAQLRGFLFFGIANAISARLHSAAACLDAGLHGEGTEGPEAGPQLAAGGPFGARQRAAAERLYARDSSKHSGALWAFASAPKFLLLDFSRVKGIDATAARTLAALFRDLGQLEITPVVTAAGHHRIRQLLCAHGAPLPPAPTACAGDATPFLLRSAAVEGGEGLGTQLHCHEFVTLDEGLRFCEQQLLGVAVRGGLCRPPSEAVGVEDMLRSHAGQAALPFLSRDECGAVAAELSRFCQKLRFRQGDVLWNAGQPADEFYIIEQGWVVVEQQVMQPGFADPALCANGSSSAGSSGAAGPPPAAGRGAVRVFEFGPACIAGAVDFYLHRPRSSTAVVGSIGGSGGGGVGGGAGGGSSCRVLRVSRNALGRMAADAPAALHALQAVVLRAKCSDLGAAAELAIT